MPALTHLVLVVVLIVGLMQAGVYLFPHRVVDTSGRACVCAAIAKPDAPATNAPATTSIEMALRNSYNPPKTESSKCFLHLQEAERAPLYHPVLP